MRPACLSRFLRAYSLKEHLQSLLCMPNQCDVGCIVLTDHRGVDVQMNQSLRGSGGGRSTHLTGETCADGQDDVGTWCGIRRCAMPIIAHTERQCMIFGDCPLALRRCGDWSPQSFRERL